MKSSLKEKALQNILHQTVYQWAVIEFPKAVNGDQFKPAIIITDNDAGLRNDISTVWPFVTSLFCL